MEPIVATAKVKPAPPRAFELFQAHFADWWPPENSYAGHSTGIASRLVLGGGVDALCSEIGPHGFRIDWGRTVEFAPPKRMVFLWQIGAQGFPDPDPARASEVEVTFAPDGDGCHVTVVHAGFERHGDGAEPYHAGMASEEGWPGLVRRFKAFADAA